MLQRTTSTCGPFRLVHSISLITWRSLRKRESGNPYAYGGGYSRRTCAHACACRGPTLQLDVFDFKATGRQGYWKFVNTTEWWELFILFWKTVLPEYPWCHRRADETRALDASGTRHSRDLHQAVSRPRRWKLNSACSASRIARAGIGARVRCFVSFKPYPLFPYIRLY